MLYALSATDSLRMIPTYNAFEMSVLSSGAPEPSTEQVQTKGSWARNATPQQVSKADIWENKLQKDVG